jgi:hypothetical protein
VPTENTIAPNVRAALDYSRSFATAKPNIGLTEKEHIEGLANLLERTATENAALQQRLTTADQRIDELEAQAPVPPQADAQPVASAAIGRARKVESLRGAFEQRFKLDIWPVIDWLRNLGVYTDAGEAEEKLAAKEKEWTDRFHMVCECAIRPIVLERNAYQAERDTLRAFANEMVSAAFEGGSFDGGDIQDIAVKHGLLRIEQPEEECGEVCACREYGFPTECYRKTGLLKASAEPAKDDDWRMNPCKQGHRDVGAAGGVAHCYTCDEKITAPTTQEAFEQWNATHPAADPAKS